MKPNFTYNATVQRVLDGDTLDVTIQLWADLEMTARIRMAHINAPETHSTDAKEKAAGEVSKAALIAQLGGNEAIPFPHDITVKIIKQEKFGRWLSDIYLPIELFDPKDLPSNLATADKTHSLNEWMLYKGYAKPYEGGKREAAPANPFDRAETQQE